MEKTSRPFDILFKAKDKKIRVELKNSKIFFGKLEAFDAHLNIVLFEASEEKEKKIIPWIVIRGDTIVTIEGSDIK